MDRLETKIFDFLSIYLVTKQTITLQEDTIAWKKYKYIKHYFRQHFIKILLIEIYRNKIVIGVLPTNNLLVKYCIKYTYFCALCTHNEE